MKKSISIVFDDGMMYELRSLQVKKIKESEKTVSFSSIIQEILREAIRKNYL